jgi:hypothetical protein
LSTPAYSVLAHESAIDAAWEAELRPLLLRRFPRSTPSELERARSFAYAGSVIQDLGYYFAGATLQVRRTLDAFYRNAPAPDPHDRKARKAWERVQAALARLDSAPSQTAQRRN